MLDKALHLQQYIIYDTVDEAAGLSPSECATLFYHLPGLSQRLTCIGFAGDHQLVVVDWSCCQAYSAVGAAQMQEQQAIQWSDISGRCWLSSNLVTVTMA